MKKKIIILSLFVAIIGITCVSAAKISEEATLNKGESVYLIANMSKKFNAMFKADIVIGTPEIETTVQRKNWLGSWKNQAQVKTMYTSAHITKGHTITFNSFGLTRTIWSNVTDNTKIQGIAYMEDI